MNAATLRHFEATLAAATAADNARPPTRRDLVLAYHAASTQPARRDAARALAAMVPANLKNRDRAVRSLLDLPQVEEID